VNGTPAPPEVVGLLPDTELASVVDALPAVLYQVGSDNCGTLLRTRASAVLGLDDRDSRTLDDLIDPAHLAAALAMLAQLEPRSVPSASRLELVADDGTHEVLATSRRRALPDSGDICTLFAFVGAPDGADDEAELRHREAILEEAERVARIGSWDWNIATDEVTWSDEMCRIYGHEPDAFEVDLSTVLEHTIPDDRDYVRSVVEHGLATQLAFTYAHRIRRPDTGVRVLHSLGRVTEVDDAGHPLHMVGMCQDVTEQHELQELGRQFRDLYERERLVATRLRQLDELKDALVAAVSHDLRTPLTVIVGSATTLLDHDDQLDERVRDELVDNVIANTERLDHMLSDLLDLDPLRRGIVRPRLRSTDVRQLVREAIARGGYDDGRVRLVESDGSAVAQVDGPKVERIVENLVRNALRHAPADSDVDVSVEPVGDTVLLTVADRGPGVPEESHVRIFEPFERGSAGAAPTSGSGLGLAIVNQFARLHGGTAWVDDRPGGGAAFRVQLPRRPVSTTDERLADIAPIRRG
jgi:signal transduction histidine kinase